MVRQPHRSDTTGSTGKRLPPSGVLSLPAARIREQRLGATFAGPAVLRHPGDRRCAEPLVLAQAIKSW